MSYADEIFKKRCTEIIEEGCSDEGVDVRPHWEDGTPAHTIYKFGVVNEYDLRKEFPIMTLRRTALRSAVDEILWIYQKKSNNINDLKSHIWDQWANEEGSIGKAYGYQIGKPFTHHYDLPYGKSDFEAVKMDQMDAVLFDLKENPNSRRIITNMYNMDDLGEMNLYPCAYSTTWSVSGEYLNLLLNQRSQDMLTASNWNVCQYAVLLMMVAQVTGFKPGKLVHVIANCHIYDRHIEIVKDLIKRPTFEAPQVLINPHVTNFYDFTVDDVRLNNYQYNPFYDTIEVAI